MQKQEGIEHKSARVLSATTNDSQAQKENPIRQVTDGKNQEMQSGISEKSTVADENEVRREEKIPKEKDGEAKVSRRSSSDNVAQNVVNSSLP